MDYPHKSRSHSKLMNNRISFQLVLHVYCGQSRIFRTGREGVLLPLDCTLNRTIRYTYYKYSDFIFH
jgi:hypothetical protein